MSTDASSNSNSQEFGAFKKRVAFLMALVAMSTSIIAYLQNQASARDAEADRDIKYATIQSLEHQISDNIRINYDYQVAYQNWVELDVLRLKALDEGDEALSKRYETVRDRMTGFSPLLAAPYFDFPDNLEPDLKKYEADTHLVKITTLREQFDAASVVKDGWDEKANTYIVHLTLLAVSLFLFGLAITIAGQVTRWVFLSSGVLMALFAIVSAINMWSQPIFDLREEKGVIDAFARGVGLAHQARWEESISAYNEALQGVPDYNKALVARALAYSLLDQYEAAVADYEEARVLGNQDSVVARRLAWNYYLLGQFDEAIALLRTTLEEHPDNLRIHFRLAANLLVTGQVEAALAEYENGMASAIRQVASAQAAGEVPTSNLWVALDDARLELSDLLYILETGEPITSFTPEPAKIASAEVVQRLAPDLIEQLNVLAVALEYTNQPPVGELTAELAPFKFGRPTSPEQGQNTEYEFSDTFPIETPRVMMLFEYENMQEDDLVVIKFYQDGVEDSSSRQVFRWEDGSSGLKELPLTLAIGEDKAQPAEYTLELYINAHLAQSGSFVIVEEEE